MLSGCQRAPLATSAGIDYWLVVLHLQLGADRLACLWIFAAHCRVESWCIIDDDFISRGKGGVLGLCGVPVWNGAWVRAVGLVERVRWNLQPSSGPEPILLGWRKHQGCGTSKDRVSGYSLVDCTEKS